VISTAGLDSTSCPRKKSPTGKPWTPHRSACGIGVPVGAPVPDIVVVTGRTVVALLIEEPIMGIDEEAAMKIMEEDTVMLVAL